MVLELAKAYPQVSIEGSDRIIYYPSLDDSEKASGPNDPTKITNIYFFKLGDF